MNNLLKACAILDQYGVAYSLKFVQNPNRIDIIPTPTKYPKNERIKIDFEHAFTSIGFIDRYDIKNLTDKNISSFTKQFTANRIIENIVNTTLNNSAFCITDSSGPYPKLTSKFFSAHMLYDKDFEAVMRYREIGSFTTIGLTWGSLILSKCSQEIDSETLSTTFHEIGHVLVVQNLGNKLDNFQIQDEFIAYYFQKLFAFTLERTAEAHGVVLSNYTYESPSPRIHNEAYFLAERFFWQHRSFYQYTSKRHKISKKILEDIENFERIFS